MADKGPAQPYQSTEAGAEGSGGSQVAEASQQASATIGMAKFACGHPKTWENTQLMGGQRRCKACNQRRAREGMAKLKARIKALGFKPQSIPERWDETNLTERWSKRKARRLGRAK